MLRFQLRSQGGVVQDLPVSGVVLLPEMRRFLRVVFRLISLPKIASNFSHSPIDVASDRICLETRFLPRVILTAIAAVSARAAPPLLAFSRDIQGLGSCVAVPARVSSGFNALAKQRLVAGNTCNDRLPSFAKGLMGI